MKRQDGAGYLRKIPRIQDCYPNIKEAKNGRFTEDIPWERACLRRSSPWVLRKRRQGDPRPHPEDSGTPSPRPGLRAGAGSTESVPTGEWTRSSLSETRSDGSSPPGSLANRLSRPLALSPPGSLTTWPSSHASPCLPKGAATSAPRETCTRCLQQRGCVTAMTWGLRMPSRGRLISCARPGHGTLGAPGRKALRATRSGHWPG